MTAQRQSTTAMASAPETLHDVEETEVEETIDESLVEEDLLVEEISIDGMCGVY